MRFAWCAAIVPEKNVRKLVVLSRRNSQDTEDNLDDDTDRMTIMLKRMTTIAPAIMIAALCAVWQIEGAHANNINKPQGIDARSQAKVAREIAKSRANGRTISPRQTVSECGSVEVGNVDTGDKRRRGQAAPREVVVVTGDIIAFGGNCK
jgi:hypothetical protein